MKVDKNQSCHPFQASVRSRPARRGFTLVELLVVIGIIALLISILLPTLNRARESSKRIACMSNLRQMMVAATGYMAENQGNFPYQGASSPGVSDALFPTTTATSWARHLLEYTEMETTKGWLYCPTIHSIRGDLNDQDKRLSYFANGMITQFGVKQIPQSSTVAAFGEDDTERTASIVRPYAPPAAAGYNSPIGQFTIAQSAWSGWARYADGSEIRKAHENRRNFAFADGHGESVLAEEDTSRNLGILINGTDAFEPDVVGYANPLRLGRPFWFQ